MTRRINPYKLFNGSFIPEWLEERPIKEVSLGAKLVYARLTRYAGRHGDCFPKIEQISEKTGICFSQVQRYLKELKKIGLIESSRLGKKCANRYFFLEHQWMRDAMFVQSDRSDTTSHSESDRSDPTTPMDRSDPTTPQKENQERESLNMAKKQSWPMKPLPNSEPENCNAYSRNAFEIAFDDFWDAYPRKVKKQAAEKAFEKHDCMYKIDTILSDIAWRKLNDPSWIDPQYIPHPTSYLNGHRWEDEKTETNTHNDQTTILQQAWRHL